MSTVDTEDPEDELVYHSNHPLPNDFVNFYPWACGQFEVGVAVVINKMILSEYVGTTVSVEKYLQKKVRATRNLMKAHASVMRIESQRLTFSGDAFSADPIVKIIATCNLSDRLIKLKFEKTDIPLPNKMIKILSLIARYNPYLTSIAFSNHLNSNGIYELTKFVEISTITEVYLDGCYVREGNYSLLLGDSCSLKILSLARCSLTDTIAHTIIEKLHHYCEASKELMILNLSTNKITDVGAKDIAQMLRSNRKLYSINLADNMITDDGAFAILNTMTDFTISDEELAAGRGRRFNYLQARIELVNDLVSKMTEEEFEKLKRKNVKPRLYSEDGNEYRLPSDVYMRIHNRAHFIANDSMGVFIDPYYPFYTEDGKVYCFGNNSLHHLNLAYNSLSLLSVKKVLQVLMYQRLLNRTPKGLVNINLEGNPLPQTCEELNSIDSMLVPADQTRQRMRRRSHFAPK